jgi:hypothetical protein
LVSTAETWWSTVLREMKSPFELGRRLPVRRHPGGSLGGRRCVAQHGLAVAGRLRVVGEPGVVGAPGRAQAGVDPPVNGRPAVGTDGLLDRQLGDLVAEPQPPPVVDEEPVGQQLVDGRRQALRDRLQGLRLDPAADQGRDLEDVARPGR